MGPISHFGKTELIRVSASGYVKITRWRRIDQIGGAEFDFWFGTYVDMRKCLVICSKNPQLLSHIHICPKPKVKLGPTKTFYPTLPSSVDIATARNPSLFGLTDRDLGLTEMGLQTLYSLHNVSV